MRSSKLSLLLALVFFFSLALAQEPEKEKPHEFDFFGQIVGLGDGQGTTAALIQGERLEFRPRIWIRNDNIVANDAHAILVGGEYRLREAKLAEELNFDPKRMGFYVVGQLGEGFKSNAKDAGFLFGIGTDYHLSRELNWMVIEVRGGRLPPIHSGWLALISSGLEVRF